MNVLQNKKSSFQNKQAAQAQGHTIHFEKAIFLQTGSCFIACQTFAMIKARRISRVLITLE
jgi:hypothetical protein